MKNEEWQVDVFGLLKRHWRLASIVAVAVGLVAAVAASYYLWTQPVHVVSTLGFRPMFKGADAGKYPNDTPFSPSDVVGHSILDAVYDTNKLSDYCDRDEFLRGFFVDEQSDESALLDAEFTSRLGDPRLTTVDRERIQAEFQSRRLALPAYFRLTFIWPQTCKTMPPVVISKVMNDALATWAQESDVARGVMRFPTDVLSADTLDLRSFSTASPFIRAGLIRNALTRITENVASVRKIPGASLVRLGKEQLTFLEIYGRLIDLFTFRLVPAMVSAARVSADGANARAWILEAVAEAERDQAASEGRAAAYSVALRDYAGNTPSVAPKSGAAQTSARAQEGESVSVNVDRSFIDFVMGLSKEQSDFRRTLTESLVMEQKAAVTAKMNAMAYKRLLPEAVRGGQPVAPSDVDSELLAVVVEGKRLATQFNDLYTEFARVSLRPQAAIFRIERPMTTTSLRAFTPKHVLVVAFASFIAALILAFGVLAVRGMAVDPPRASSAPDGASSHVPRQ